MLSQSADRMVNARYPWLILIGGGPASGKSEISKAVVRMLVNSVLLDKDKLFGKWVDVLLASQGQFSERDCPYYWNHIRPLEYRSLEGLAFEHLQLGKVVVLDAPLRPELDNTAWCHRIARTCESFGAKFASVWIQVSPECARARMRERAEARDKWKLDNWDEFVRRQSYDAPCGAKLILKNEDATQSRIAISKIIACVAQ